MQSKNKQKPSSRVNIPICAAGVLLCLTLFSVHLTSGLYAKYISTATGSDSARVAKFEVVTTGDVNVNVTVTSGDSTEDRYEFTIQNNSEVAVQYELSVTYEGGPAPAGVVADFDGDEDSDTLAVGASHTRSMTFNVDWAQFTAVPTGDSATETMNFTIKIHIEQID